MIELYDVSKKFGNNLAVNNISFSVKDGETLVLLGTSGCGKTTTLKMINRLIEPTAGEIKIDGKNIKSGNADILRRKIGYVMQNIGLFPHYTIRENISVVPNLLKWDKQHTNTRIDELMEKLHLPKESLNQLPATLSGGQQQRVGLARALIANPSILLMDEPFGALDNVTRASIQAEFKALDELKQKTIVMVTHDVLEAFELADRICLMDKGEIVQIGTPKTLLYQPATPFAEEFINSQRLTLEFKATTLADVWNLLPQTQLDITAKKVDVTSSIWDSLEILRNGNHAPIQVSLKSNQSKTVDFETLMSAFNQFKKPIGHG